MVENTGTLTLQAITPTQPMPSQEELDTKFAELVVSVCMILESINGNKSNVGNSEIYSFPDRFKSKFKKRELPRKPVI